jgi:hypothetical protein
MRASWSAGSRRAQPVDRCRRPSSARPSPAIERRRASCRRRDWSYPLRRSALRSIGRIGLGAGVVALLVGALAVGGSALAAGDWWLARQPWIGIGLTLTVIGLALTAVFAVVLVAVEPVGWLRLLAVPPALLVALLWALWLLVGLPTTGGGPERDIGTMLYSLPEMLVLATVATLLIASPLVVARIHSPPPAPAPER